MKNGRNENVLRVVVSSVLDVLLEERASIGAATKG